MAHDMVETGAADAKLRWNCWDWGWTVLDCPNF